MGAPSFETDQLTESPVQSFGFVDYVICRMKQDGLQYRDLAIKIGLSKTRTHNVFHPEPSKRRPLYVHEFHAVAAALDLSPLEAALVSDLYSGAGEAHDGVESQIKLYSGVVNRLHGGMLEVMERFDGLDWDDIRPAHAEWIIKLVMGEIETAYAEFVDRKAVRLREQETF
ncbi:hypothetical protein [Sphingobium yanoikuyae]|uniref:hypothetical protein n=1 Tax=Sphingobium yanoikuyae TaxID=13690 RepID=UPI00240FB4E3|nr:hypothetical protein [Sphingobium yanoikuyae]